MGRPHAKAHPQGARWDAPTISPTRQGAARADPAMTYSLGSSPSVSAFRSRPINAANATFAGRPSYNTA